MRIILRNDLGELTRLSEAVRTFCMENHIQLAIQEALHLALDEVVTNIVFYAFPKDAVAEFTVDLGTDSQVVWAEVRDSGTPFNPLEDARCPDLNAPLAERRVGGLGVHFVKVFMDTIHYERRGGENVLRLTIQANPSAFSADESA